MAPLPVQTSGRYFIDYQNAVASHTMVIRCDDNRTFPQLDAAIVPFLNAITPLVTASVVTSTRYANAGQTFSNPQATSLVGKTFGANTATVEQNTVALTFVGRDQLGHRSRLSVFGFRVGLSNYRLTSAESADVSTAVAALNNAVGTFWAISNTKPVWYNFADVKSNDYWVRRARG